MATKRGISGDKDGMNHENFLCTECSKLERESYAEKYCVLCKNYLCEVCLTSHQSMPNMPEHDLVDIFMVCQDHPGKIIDMICETHDEVGCINCMETKHCRPCQTLYIDEKCDILFNAQKIQEAVLKLQSSIATIERTLGLRNTCHADFKKVKEDTTKELDFYYEQLKENTQQLMGRMEDLYKRTRSKLDLLGKEIRQILNDQKSALGKELFVAKTRLQQINKSASGEKVPQVVCSKLADATTRRCDDVVNRNGFPYVLFQPSVTFDDLFRVFHNLEKSLGNFSVVRPYETELRYTRNVSVKAADEDDYSVMSDKYDCFITGSCSLLDGTILFVDHNNSCLKRVLPRDYMVSDIIHFCFLPRDVCVINQRELAVTMRERRRVQIVSIGSKMALTRMFDVAFKCDGITHHAGELLMTGWNAVNVYSVAGERLRQICPKDEMGKPMFVWMYNLAVSDCGRMIFLAGGIRGITALDTKDGRKLWQNRLVDWSYALYVCIDGRGSVFVCGGGSRNRSHIVAQFSQKGQRLGWTTTKADEITAPPQSVCYDQSTSRLFVSKYLENDPKRGTTKKPYYWWNNDVAVCKLTTL